MRTLISAIAAALIILAFWGQVDVPHFKGDNFVRSAHGQITGPCKDNCTGMAFSGTPTVASANNTALDCTANAGGVCQSNGANSGVATSVTLSTVNTNVLVFVSCYTVNAAMGVPTSTHSLAFVQRAKTAADGTNQLYVWYAPSTGALSGEVITTDVGNNYIWCVGWAVSGANLSTKFDSNVALPNAGVAPAIATSNANDFLYASLIASNNTGSTGATWQPIVSPSFHFIMAQYKIVTATQPSTAVPITGDTIDEGIGDAVVSN